MTKADGTLCTTWDYWQKSTPICVSVYQVKNGLILVNTTTKKLETIMLDENIKTGNQLG